MQDKSIPPREVSFDQVKNRIQLYKRDSLTELILKRLNHVQETGNIRYPIWVLLALLKWTYMCSSGDRFKQKINKVQFDALVGLVEKFEAGYKGINFKANSTRSFLIVIYQQAIINEQFYNAMVDRQIVLFNKINTKFDVQQAFKDATSIKLIDFFNYCHFTYLYLNKRELAGDFQQDGILHEDDYQRLFISAYGADQLRCFLDLLTVTSIDQFSSLHKLGDEQLQLFETNFFLTKPFLLFRDKYVNAHKATFVQTINYFVYTFMKAKLPDGFPDDFGRRMEQYVGMGLKEASILHKNENELKKIYTLKKVTDYLIEDDILVESKATELHPRSGVLRLPNIITSEMNTSIIKAYIQILSTAKAINPGKEWFGIIVTYREMYLGHGRLAWGEFMEQPVTQRAAEEGLDVTLVPPENLFFISLEYWDYMMQIVQNKQATIKEILLKTRECCNSNDPSKKRILMDMVLMEYFQVQQMKLRYLTDAHSLLDYTDKIHD